MLKVFNCILCVCEYINLFVLIIVCYCVWFCFEIFYCGILELVKFWKLGEVYKMRCYVFLKKKKNNIDNCLLF